VIIPYFQHREPKDSEARRLKEQPQLLCATCASAETFISINDQTTGHMKFMETASDKLTNFKKDWFILVAFPAFETNLITIYERQAADEKKVSH
jgi:hypothetical protein